MHSIEENQRNLVSKDLDNKNLKARLPRCNLPNKLFASELISSFRKIKFDK